MVWLLSAALAAGAFQRLDAGFFVLALSVMMSRGVRRWARLAMPAILVACFIHSYCSVGSLRRDISWFEDRVGRGPVHVEGTVSGFPASQPYGVSFPMETSIEGRRLRLLVRASRFRVHYGDRVSMKVYRVRPRNDMSSYLLSRRCAGIVRARYGDIDVVARGAGGWRFVAGRAHDGARRSIAALLGARAGLPLALVLGERAHVSRRMKAHFNALGIAHLLALSGMHLGVLIALLVATTRLLRRRPGLIVSVVVVIYIVIVGEVSSLTRAMIMILLLMLSRRIQRPPAAWHALGCALGLMLLTSPELAHSVSFQLSFSAMAAVLLAGSRFLGPLAHLRGWGRRLIVAGWATFATSCAVGIALVPLQVHYFDAIPVVGPIATILFFPPVALILALSMALAVIGKLPLIGEATATLLDFLLAMFDRYLHWADAVFPDPVTVSAPDPVLYLAALVVGFCYPRKRWGLPVAVLFGAMAFAFADGG